MMLGVALIAEILEAMQMVTPPAPLTSTQRWECGGKKGKGRGWQISRGSRTCSSFGGRYCSSSFEVLRIMIC